MSDVTFTGERLHADDALFGVDLAQHRAAYLFAIERAGQGRVLELGSGTGYGSAEIAQALGSLVALDRVAPLHASRRSGARYVRADLNAVPFRAAAFDQIVSFQVIEHLEDPSAYLGAIARLLHPDGEALITTPNLLTSLGVNPYHVHEYTGAELADTLRRYFRSVDVRGVGASEPVARYLAARRARITRIMKIDPLGLHKLLPRGLVDWLFGALAVVVRRGVQRDDALPEVTPRDFPIAESGPAADDCVDLLAVCREPI